MSKNLYLYLKLLWLTMRTLQMFLSYCIVLNVYFETSSTLVTMASISGV